MKSAVRSELVLRQDLPGVVCAEVQQVEDDDASVVLSTAFTVTKMILENINQAKTRTNERHEETSEKGKES